MAKELYQLRCDRCEKVFLFDKKAPIRIIRGWKSWNFCSWACKRQFAKQDFLQARSPMSEQPEAERKAEVAKAVSSILARKRS